MSLDFHGARDFRDAMRQQKSPYSIFAVNLPIEELVPELQKRFQIEEWQQNIDRNGKLGDLVGVPIIKFKENPWSIIYWSIGRHLNVTEDCQYVSRKFDCTAVAMYESDTSAWVEWNAYQGEDEIESSQRITYDDNDTVEFESQLRECHEVLDEIEDETILRSKLDDLLDELLIQKDLAIPSLNIDLNHQNIERLDLLILPTRPLGMSDFQKWMYQGHPEYSIFAVKGNIDIVIPALIKDSKTAEWQKDIQSEAKIWDVIPQSAPYFKPVIQPTGNQWTIVYWYVGDWMDVSGLCSKMSLELNTLAIMLGEEDTSGAIGYELFDCGKSIERMEVCPGDEMFFESKVREEPEFDDFDEDESDTINQFVNVRFAEEGVYIPSWELRVSDDWIGRVDLIAID